jgi:hypothetical protein
MRLSCAMALVIALAGRLPAAEDTAIVLGMPIARVMALRGKPIREVRTENGSLLFYNTLLISVENGAVTFLSRISGEAQADPGSVPGTMAPAADGPAPDPELRKSPPPPPPSPSAPPMDWIEEGKEKQVKLVAERIRRCIAMESYGRVLARVPWQDYYAGRHHSYNGNGAVVDQLSSGGRKLAEDAVPDGVTFVDLRDSQSLAVPRHGEAFQRGERASARQSVSLGEASR